MSGFRVNLFEMLLAQICQIIYTLFKYYAPVSIVPYLNLETKLSSSFNTPKPKLSTDNN